MIGMIVPPGEIKKMVEKTASHVAKNGSEFEKALMEIEQNKPQFSFLLRENPYRAYYDYKVAEFSRKLLAENDENTEKKDEESLAKIQAKIEKEEIKNADQAEFLQKIFEQVKEPDPDRFTAEIPEKTTRADVAMIQHTAQFVAVNGKNFLIALSERQKNNPQFEFLRTSSENNQYFTKVVDAYIAVLAFNEESLQLLQKYANSKEEILKSCKQVYEFHRLKQEQSKGKSTDDEGKKQSNIDWNDFELVETIIFDDFKPRAGYSEEFKLNKPLFSNKNMEEKIISEPKKKQLLQQCHICKKNILASEMTVHLKACLGSKKGSANQSNKRGLDSEQAVDVSKNLESLSQRRPDIFGGDGQHIRKNEQALNEQQQKAIWDGQAPNMTRATASAAMLINQQKKIKQQLHNKK